MTGICLDGEGNGNQYNGEDRKQYPPGPGVDIDYLGLGVIGTHFLASRAILAVVDLREDRRAARWNVASREDNCAMAVFYRSDLICSGCREREVDAAVWICGRRWAFLMMPFAAVGENHAKYELWDRGIFGVIVITYGPDVLIPIEYCIPCD